MKQTLKHATVASVAELVNSRGGITAFFDHEDTVTSELQKLVQVLRTEAVCLDLFYSLLGTPFDSEYELNTIAAFDLGRAFGVEFKVLIRTTFVSFPEGKIDNADLFSTHCRRLARLSNYPYIKTLDDIIQGYLVECATMPRFMKKIWGLFYGVDRKYMKTQQEKIATELFDTLSNSVALKDLSAHTIGYLSQIGFTFDRYDSEKRSTTQLIEELEALLMLGRKWFYLNTKPTLEIFSTVFHYFTENKKELIAEAHIYRIAEFVQKHASETPLKTPYTKITEYSSQMKIKLSIVDQAEFEKRVAVAWVKGFDLHQLAKKIGHLIVIE